MGTLTQNHLNQFRQLYHSSPQNKLTEDAIRRVGLKQACLRTEVLSQTYNVFNLELPPAKIYNQADSSRCWLHAGINFIQYNV